jgi:hypothetical protein
VAGAADSVSLRRTVKSTASDGRVSRLYIARDNSVREIRCGPDFVYNMCVCIFLVLAHHSWPSSLNSYPHMSNTQPNGKVEPITAIAKLRSAHFGFSHLYWAGADKVRSLSVDEIVTPNP